MTDGNEQKLAVTCAFCGNAYAAKRWSDGNVRPIGRREGCVCGSTEFDVCGSSITLESDSGDRKRDVLRKLGDRAVDGADLDRLFVEATTAVVEVLDADSCKVLEVLPNGDRVLLRQGVGWKDGFVGNTTVPTDRDSQAGYALYAGEPVVVEDLRTENRFSGPDLLVEHDVVSGVSVIIGSADDPWGVLGTYTTTKREFDEEAVTFVENVANVLALAIEASGAQRRLEAERSLKDRILETSPIGITLVDADGMNVYANDRAEEILGRSLDEFRTYVRDDDRWRLVDETGAPLPSDELPFSRVRETGDPAFDEVIGIDRLDGERVWISAHCAPLFDDGDEFDGAVYALEEITERKRLEEGLETTCGRISDAFYSLDSDWNVTYVNDRAAEVIGAESSTLLGENAWETFPEAADGVIEEECRRAMRTQDQTTFEVYYRPLESWFEVRVYPSETGLSVYFRDVSERKERERELEASNERLEQFAHAVSHDLREPLRVVAQYLELIERRHGDELNDDCREFLAFAGDGAERMREMIDGLLAFSRVETHGDPVDRVDLDAVLEDALDDLRVQLDENDAEITSDPLPHVDGDGNQLRRVFQNLVSNAITYSGDESPNVDVSARREGDEWAISVRDDGIGIDPDDTDRIFGVFRRLHAVDEYAGSGIGLALCQRIVERHGGEIRADSEPGEGSTFTFTLPVTADRETG